MNHAITPVGFIRSPFKEKFAVPRQPGLAPSAIASIVLDGDANNEDTLRGIEQFSHLWYFSCLIKTSNKDGALLFDLPVSAAMSA